MRSTPGSLSVRAEDEEVGGEEEEEEGEQEEGEGGGDLPPRRFAVRSPPDSAAWRP